MTRKPQIEEQYRRDGLCGTCRWFSRGPVDWSGKCLWEAPPALQLNNLNLEPASTYAENTCSCWTPEL